MEELQKNPEEEQPEQTPREEKAPEEAYVERPRWQVWGARIALVLFALFLVLYYCIVAGGGT